MPMFKCQMLWYFMPYFKVDHVWLENHYKQYSFAFFLLWVVRSLSGDYACTSNFLKHWNSVCASQFLTYLLLNIQVKNGSWEDWKMSRCKVHPVLSSGCLKPLSKLINVVINAWQVNFNHAWWSWANLNTVISSSVQNLFTNCT